MGICDGRVVIVTGSGRGIGREHALAYAAKLAATLPKDKLILANLSGRGDKDMHTVAEKMGLDFS